MTDPSWSGYYGLTRLNLDGSLDEAFHARVTANGPVFALLIQPDDKIVLLGYAANSSTYQTFVTRYTAAGKLDTTFNAVGYNGFSGPRGTVVVGRAIARQADGKILIAEQVPGFDSDFDLWMARFNANGTLDTSFADRVV